MDFLSNALLPLNIIIVKKSSVSEDILPVLCQLQWLVYIDVLQIKRVHIKGNVHYYSKKYFNLWTLDWLYEQVADVMVEGFLTFCFV